METFRIIKIDGVHVSEEDASVVREIPLTIHLNNEELATLLCSPSDLKELSLGFLRTAGLVGSMSDVKSFVLDDKSWRSWIELSQNMPQSELIFKRLYTSGCGRGVVLYNAADALYKNVVIENGIRFKSDEIINLMREFSQKSELFKKTGGVHSAALADASRIIFFYEDIGRHNAVDKVLGKALIEDADVGGKVLLMSGRISSEIYHKAIKAGVAALVSRGAPTDQAVKLGRKNNMTIVGFVRGDRMNIYSGKERII